jgi:WD40 repeat protein
MQPGLQDREEVPSSLVGAKSGDRAPSAYDGFISYSHAADGQLAPALQDALQRFAKPWYKRRALRLFRDKTTLTATPALWPTIETALNQSRFFLLLASPDAARSHWVQQELEWWLTHRSRGTLLIAITGGALVWDDKGGDFDWNQTDALAIGLKGVFSTEPLWVDLRFAKQATQLSPKDPAFQNAVADLAAPLRGQPKDDLIGEDVRQHRRTLRLARGAVATLIGLVVALTVAAVVAVKQRDTAISQQRLATSRQLSAQALNRLPDRLDLALLLANQAYTIQGTIEARGSLLSAQEFSPFLTAFLHGHTGIVDSVAFNPDGSLLAGGSSDGSVWIWSVATRQPVGPPLIGGHSAPDNRVSNTDVLNSVAFSPDGQLLASGGADQKVRLWNVASRSLVMPPLEGHDDIVDTVAFSHDGKRLASAGWDRTIRLWDPTSGQPAGPPLEAHEMPITSIAFSPDDRLLASACMDGSLLLWDLSSGQPLIPPLAYPKAATGGTTNGVAFSPDGTILASTSNDGTIRLWDVAKRAPRGTLSGYGGAVTTVVFSPDGAKLVFGGEEGTLRQWDVAAGRVIGVPFEGHAGAIISVGFSPNGTTLASAGEDGTVRLWDAAQRPPLSTTLSGHRSIVGSAVFSPDGKLVASASNDQTVQLWDAGTGKPVGTLIGHTDIVNSVAFSADGTLLASGSQDGTVRFWDVDKRQAVGSIVTGHTSGVKSVALSRDGRILATGGRDEFTENPRDREISQSQEVYACGTRAVVNRWVLRWHSPAPSTAWPSIPMLRSSCPAVRTRRCGCGT